MRPDLVRSARLGGVVVFAAIAAAAVRPTGDHAGAEVVRLRAHFDSVDVELRSRDISQLTPAQRQRRATLVQWLREYRDAGAFPTNDRFPGRLVPFFRDSRGVLCAMAYLIDRSGRSDIVDQVASTRNNAFLRELQDDSTLIAWLDENGLSISEAARIQPSYDYDPEGTKVSSDFALQTIAFGSGSLATTAVNLVKPTLVGEVLGVLMGGGAIVNGIAHSDQNSGTTRVANVSIVAGTIAIAGSIGGFFLQRARAHKKTQPTAMAKLNFAPVVVSAPNSYRLGLIASAKF